MRRHVITTQTTLAGCFQPLVFAFIVFAIVAQTSVLLSKWIIWVTAAAMLYLAGRALLNAYHLRRRSMYMARLIAARPDYQKLDDDVIISGFIGSLGAIDELHGRHDPRVTNVLGTPDWTYADFVYNLHGRIKSAEYVRAKVHYGIMTTMLPRKLPNIFFDSAKARGRQFRFHFAASQRHSLEGDFDEHFVTYFPEGYTIDSMSFISPEVMWALRDARDYDIEIYGNRLFLYGPLFDPETQLQDMSVKLAEIKKQLANDITTYRDERLPFAEGRKRVAATGMSLRINIFWKVVGILAAIGYFIMYVFAAR